jgi:hypothetical protein
VADFPELVTFVTFTCADVTSHFLSDTHAARPGWCGQPVLLARFENSPLHAWGEKRFRPGSRRVLPAGAPIRWEDGAVEKTDWQPVTDAAGKVLGWMSAPAPGEPDVDYFDADRPRKVRLRAARLEEAAGLFTDDAFDVEETWDAGLAAGLTDDDLNSAGNVALLLWKVERGIS